jgi:hypothetical protein
MRSGSGDRRYLVATQRILLALLHRAHAGTIETVPEDAKNDHHRHDLENGRALMRIEHLREGEEEKERKKIVEEKDGAVSQRELQVDLEQSEKRFH